MFNISDLMSRSQNSSVVPHTFKKQFKKRVTWTKTTGFVSQNLIKLNLIIFNINVKLNKLRLKRTKLNMMLNILQFYQFLTYGKSNKADFNKKFPSFAVFKNKERLRQQSKQGRTTNRKLIGKQEVKYDEGFCFFLFLVSFMLSV